MRLITKISLRLLVLSVLSFAANSGLAENLPKYRPALLGNHSRSLVNLINTQGLMKRGQGDAMIMFECGINRLGYSADSRAYRGSPNSDLLRDEVLARINEAQFEPGVYNHHHVPVYLVGTVFFVVRDGKPHVRIFLHQDDDLLKSGADFVAPQFAFIPGNTKFKGIFYPPQAPGKSGVASLKLTVDGEGNVQGAKVIYEHPPGVGFGRQAAGPIRDAVFIPGFRNGKPVACSFTWSLIFSGVGRQMQTG